ncbi:hypothetical protein [Bifidobacterium myosotis]|uniref:Uncharacterized protein n=1 Tax=Bifidobacterium myosotis TaxID=1630166 RepID=A0A5M9ZKS7_9BIFI|nr:hypothetical protein [Bifidobacterium myosotis]KAA8828115.1 hypothetical protein EMO91_06655 [Bifidobacterium myosotis]
MTDKGINLTRRALFAAMLDRLLSEGGYGPGTMPARVVGWDSESNARETTTVYYETADGGGGVRVYDEGFGAYVRRACGYGRHPGAFDTLRVGAIR